MSKSKDKSPLSSLVRNVVVFGLGLVVGIVVAGSHGVSEESVEGGSVESVMFHTLQLNDTTGTFNATNRFTQTSLAKADTASDFEDITFNTPSGTNRGTYCSTIGFGASNQDFGWSTTATESAGARNGKITLTTRFTLTDKYTASTC